MNYQKILLFNKYQIKSVKKNEDINFQSILVKFMMSLLCLNHNKNSFVENVLIILMNQQNMNYLMKKVIFYLFN